MSSALGNVAEASSRTFLQICSLLKIILNIDKFQNGNIAWEQAGGMSFRSMGDMLINITGH